MPAEPTSPTMSGRGADDGSGGARRWLGDGAWLVGGAAVNGLFAYAYLAFGTREYGAADFAPVSVLWSIWAVTGAAVVFPIQHEVTRRLESGRGEAPVRDILVSLSLVVVALAVMMAAVTWALAEPLFGSTDLVNPLMAGWIVAGAGLSGLVRGTLAGRRQFVGTGVAIAAENVARFGGAVVVLAAGWSVSAYTLALGLGPLAMLVWVGDLRFSRIGESLPSERGLRGLGRTFGGLAGASMLSQIVLTSSPVILALGGGAAAAVTSLFAALALLRAPYLLLLGLTARVTGTLTRLVSAGDDQRLRRARWIFAGGSFFTAAVFFVFAISAGEGLLHLLFGPTIELDPIEIGWLAAGSGLAVGAILLVLLLVARGGAPAALAAWLVALVPAAVLLALAPSGEVGSVIGAFVVAECGAVVALTVFDDRVGRAALAQARP